MPAVVAFRHRRSLLKALTFAPALLLPSAAGALSVVDLDGLGKAIDAAASAVGKIGDAVAHLISLGDSGFSVVSARKARDKLKDIDARLTDLTRTTQSSLVQSMQGYAQLGRAMLAASPDQKDAMRANLQSSWGEVLDGIQEVLAGTRQLLDDLRNDRSDFVLEEARGLLLNVLDAKVGLLDRLKYQSAPTAPEQLNQIDSVAASFDALRQKTIETLKQMSDYIKNSG